MARNRLKVRTTRIPPRAQKRLHQSFFARSVHEVAPELIGASFLFDGVGGVIVIVVAVSLIDILSQAMRRRLI